MSSQAASKDEIFNAIYESAIDSLRIGMEFLLKETSPGSAFHCRRQFLRSADWGWR